MSDIQKFEQQHTLRMGENIVYFHKRTVVFRFKEKGRNEV